MLCLLRLLGLLLRGRSGKAIATSALLAVCASALAESGCIYAYKTGSYKSGAEACAAYVSDVQPGNPGNGYNLQNVEEGPSSARCVFRVSSSGGSWTEYVNIGKECRCPTGSTDPACNNTCAANAGQMSTLNYTRGWARGPLPNKQDQLGATADIPTSICNEGCKYAVLGNEQAYRSQVPSAQGLYRLSSDVSVIQTDQQCVADATTTAVSPQTPDKPCPGQLGELDGKPYCAVAPGDTGVQPAGPPGKEADDKGNPSAGTKPSSGEGSGTGGVGRTPSQGSGGNAGGPAGAAFGGSGNKPGDKPDGTTNKPGDGKEQAACGAPGQPKCAIDETGTPKVSPNEYDKAVDQYKIDMDAIRAKVAGTEDKSYFEGWKSMWFAPAVAACQPFALPSVLGVSLAIDPCAVVEGIRYFMAYVWAIVGLAICVQMIGRTIRGSA